MHLVGRYTTDTTRLFTITTSGLKSRWNLYSTRPLDDESGEELNPYALDKKYLHDYNKYLFASCTCIGKGDINARYGNVDLIIGLMQSLSALKLLDPIFSFTQDLGRFSNGSITIDIVSANSAYSNINPMRGLTFFPYTATGNAHNGMSAFKLSLAKSRIKTFDDIIRDGYNISWLYRDGVMIKDYQLITTEEDFFSIVAELEDESVQDVSFDSETTGLKFFWYGGDATLRSRICGISISWKDDQGIYIPFLSTQVDTLDVDMVLSVLVPILNKKNVIAHNGAFDQKVLYSYGYMLHIKNDTMLMEFNLDPHVARGSKGLKLMTRKYFNHETLELEDILGKNFNPEAIPEIEARLIKIYACADTDYTLRLYKHLKEFIRDPDAYGLDMKIMEILSIAEFYSSRLDLDLMHTLSEINRRDLNIIEQVMYRYIDEIGRRTQAINLLRLSFGEDYEINESEINELMNDERFTRRIDPIFRKQTKKAQNSWDPSEWRLQISSPQDIVHILYNVLDYPVTQIDPETGKWKANEDALLDLLSESTTEPVNFLKTDIVSCITEYDIPVSKKESTLISKDKFEGYKYPFAYLLAEWRKLYKFRTSFFDKLEKENTNGWYCTSNSMTSAETSRVINPIQTLVGSLKKLVVAHSDEWYPVIFDMAQIEFRVMLGLANNYWTMLEKTAPEHLAKDISGRNLDFLIEKLNHPEADYHREGGAIFAGCTPEDMTKDQRSKVKAVHFSVPYGAGSWSIAKDRLREAHNVLAKNYIVEDTEATLAAWRKNLYPLYYYLESKRDKAVTEVPQSLLPPLLKGGHYGMVDNPLGRHRWFNLADLTRKKIAGIRRQAGNYPIQSFAREIFFTAILKLYKRLCKEGYITQKVGSEKVILNLFIHDEVHLMVHKSIHPYKIYQMIWEECLIELQGHPKYYMGISVVDNWYEGKLDEFEAPVDFVQSCVKEYYAHPERYADGMYELTESRSQKDFIFDNIKAYMANRFTREIQTIQASQPDPYVIDPVYFCDHFKNYFLKSRYWLYTTPLNHKECYKTGASRQSEQDKIIAFMEAYLFNADRDLWSNYSMLWNGKPVKFCDIYEPIIEVATTGESDTVSGDVSLDFDFDFDLPETSEDANEREEMFNREYYLLTESDVSISARINKQTNKIITEDGDSHVDAPMWNRVSWEDFMNRIVIDITKVDSKLVVEAARYLGKFKSNQGQSVIFYDGKQIPANVKISNTFDKKLLFEILHPELRVSVESSKTNYFD